MVKRRIHVEGKEAVGASQSCSLTKAFPALAEFLAETVFDDGTPRQTGTLMLFAEDGRWKGWLHDREQGLSCFLSNTTLQTLLEGLDAALTLDELDWRPDRPKTGGAKPGR